MQSSGSMTFFYDINEYSLKNTPNERSPGKSTKAIENIDSLQSPEKVKAPLQHTSFTNIAKFSLDSIANDISNLHENDQNFNNEIDMNAARNYLRCSDLKG